MPPQTWPLTIGVISSGDMGLNIARLLAWNSIPVIMNSSTSDSIPLSVQPRQTSGITIVTSIVDLYNSSDIVISAVTPGEAIKVAKHVSWATTYGTRSGGSNQYYIDLNTVSHATVKMMERIFEPAPGKGSQPLFVDGAVFGPAPSLMVNGREWKKPKIIISGPHTPDRKISDVLGLRVIGQAVGQASALKMCFISLTRGLTALGVQSFATAHAFDVLPALRSELSSFGPPFGPGLLGYLDRNVTDAPPNAHRCIDEMLEAAATHAEAGFEPDVFSGVAQVYQFLSEDTRLGQGREQGHGLEFVLESINEAFDGKRAQREALMEMDTLESGETSSGPVNSQTPLG